MALIRWKDEYLTSIGSIDEQHQRLFELINAIYDMMRLGRGAESIAAALSDLTEYTRFHFGSEETLMSETGFSSREAHAAEHVRLLDEIRELRHRILDGSTVMTMNEMYFLKDWLLNHFTGADQGLAKHLKKSAIPSGAASST
ncbi:MAG: hemerythrin family protein [Fibrobacteria bacterium]|nr:hemerythrin family protein [Fibrobacteria bacterium]